MPEDLQTFKAVFAEWEGLEFRIVTIEFRIEDEREALVIAEDLAILEDAELIYLSKC